MRLERLPQHYQSDDGRYVDKVETDGDYTTIYLREIEDGRYLIVGERADGSRFTDVQDALHTLGFTVRPHCVDQLTELQGNSDSARQSRDTVDLNDTDE